MHSINDLKLTEDKIEIPAEIPEQFGSFAPPPQPGYYRFKMPSSLTKIWDLVDVTNEEVKKRVKSSKALVAIFSNDYPLTVTHARDESYIGQTFLTRVQVAPRHRGNNIYISDMYYLLEKGFDHDMSDCKSWKPRAWADALITHANEEFGARVEWSAFCNPNKVRYILDDQGNAIEDPSGVKGCGANVYEPDIPRNEDKTFMLRFECGSCGEDDGTHAYLRAYANLAEFKKVG